MLNGVKEMLVLFSYSASMRIRGVNGNGNVCIEGEAVDILVMFVVVIV